MTTPLQALNDRFGDRLEKLSLASKAELLAWAAEDLAHDLRREDENPPSFPDFDFAYGLLKGSSARELMDICLSLLWQMQSDLNEPVFPQSVADELLRSSQAEVKQ